MPKTEKSYYRIREVVAMLDIPAYTLRFWEDEFPMLKPDRTPAGQRRYTPADVEIVRRIRELLYEKGLKIDAAIKMLNATYHKCPPRRLPVCNNDTDAIRLLQNVKDTLNDAHCIAKIETVIKWIENHTY